MRLVDRVAIVTGGDTGIGKAICLALAREGASVVVDYHGDTSTAVALIEQIQNLGGEAVADKVDVTKAEEVEALVERTVKHYGGLDIVVNNAGIEHKGSFLDVPFDVYREVIDVNLTGVWLCSQIGARQMVKQRRGGRIINISSIHENVTMPQNAPYCAAKGGVRMLMRTIAIELAQYGVTVNDICPGAVDTPMDTGVKHDPAKLEALLGEIPLRRMARPEEVAGVAVFLASDEAAYITASSYVVDGGMSHLSGSL